MRICSADVRIIGLNHLLIKSRGWLSLWLSTYYGRLETRVYFSKLGLLSVGVVATVVNAMQLAVTSWNKIPCTRENWELVLEWGLDQG